MRRVGLEAKACECFVSLKVFSREEGGDRAKVGLGWSHRRFSPEARERMT